MFYQKKHNIDILEYSFLETSEAKLETELILNRKDLDILFYNCVQKEFSNYIYLFSGTENRVKFIK